MLPYTENAEIALKEAEKVSRELRHYYIGCEHLLVGLIREGKGVAASVLLQNGITEPVVISLIKDFSVRGQGTLLKDKAGLTPRTERVLEESERIAEEYHSNVVGTEHILLAILKDRDNTAIQIIMSLKKSPVELYAVTLLAMGENPKAVKDDLKKKEKEKGKDFLQSYSRDLTALAHQGKLYPVVGRNDEITRVVQILSRRGKNNPCLVGEPGVGKTAIVEGLAARIVAGEVPDTVKNKRILTLDLAGMVAGTKYRGEFEEKMKKLLSEVSEDRSIILFLDEIHTLIGAGGSEGAIDAANILKPALSRGEIQLIGATTLTEYRKYVEKDAALESAVKKAVIYPIVLIVVLIFVLLLIIMLHLMHNRIIYINDRFLPDKAIDLIDEAGASVRIKNLKVSEKAEELKNEILKIDLQIARSIKIEAYAQAIELKHAQDDLYKRLERLLKREKTIKEHSLYLVDENHIADVVAIWTKVPVKKLTEKKVKDFLSLSPYFISV